MYQILTLLITFFFLNVNSVVPQSKFIADYFLWRNTLSIDVFMCNKEDSISFMQFMLKSNHLVFSFSGSQSNKFDLVSYVSEGSWNSRRGLFFDMSCKSSRNILQKELPSNIISSSNLLLWVDSYENINNLILNKEFINFESDICIAVPNLNNSVLIYNLYMSNGKIEIKLTKYLQESLNFESSFVKKRLDLTGLILHGAINVIDNPMNDKLMGETDIKNIDPMTEFVLNIHGYLRDMYSFQWKLLFVDNKQLSNESIEFQHNINDLDFLITTEKLGPSSFQKATLLPPIKYVRQCFLFLHPPIFTFPAFYTRPLSVDLWVGLGTLLLGSAILYYIICCFDVEDIDYNERSFSGCFLVPLGILANQGLNVLADRISKRIIQFTLLEFDIIVWCFYSAVILNYLLYPTFIILENTDDLLYEGFTFGKENIPFNNITSVEKADKLNTEINSLINSSVTLDLVDGVEEMMRSKFAFYTVESNVYRMAPILFRKDQICNLVSLPLHKDYGISMYIKDQTNLKDYFQRGILLLKEFGIIDREDKRYNRINLKCTGTVEFVQIGVHSTLFACKIYITGILVSASLLFVELFCFKVLKLKLDYV